MTLINNIIIRYENNGKIIVIKMIIFAMYRYVTLSLLSFVSNVYVIN